MKEGALHEIKFNDRVPVKRLYRDRFVFPEALMVLFKNNDDIVDAIEKEINLRIKENTVKNFSSEIIIKNIAGPFFDDLSQEEKESLIKVASEMKIDMTEIKEEKNSANSDSAKRKVFVDNELRKITAEAQKLWQEEAMRAGDVSEVARTTEGEVKAEGDSDALQGRILEINDEEDVK